MLQIFPRSGFIHENLLSRLGEYPATYFSFVAADSFLLPHPAALQAEFVALGSTFQLVAFEKAGYFVGGRTFAFGATDVPVIIFIKNFGDGLHRKQIRRRVE
jgi:hypothetical protein